MEEPKTKYKICTTHVEGVLACCLQQAHIRMHTHMYITI